MSPHEPDALIADALAQAEDILRKVRDASLETLLVDSDLQAILERRFEILGEALARLSRCAPERFARIESARQAVDLRNFIAHGYDSVDHRILWSTATSDIPVIRDALARELEQPG